MIERAVNKLVNYFENKNIPVNKKELTNQVLDWFCNSDIGDIDILCGCVSEYGHYNPGYTKEDMLEAGIIFKGMEAHQLAAYPHISEIECQF